MKFRHIDELVDTNRVIDTPEWSNRGLILKDDRMGYSVHDVIVKPGTEKVTRHKHHLETVYCIRGKGKVEDTRTGETYPVTPGAVYALDRNDQHVLRATTEMQLVCVYSPPLTGAEVLDEEGSFNAFGEETIFVIGLNDFNQKLLAGIRQAEHYNFVNLLDRDDILETQTYDIEKLIHQAKQEIRHYKGSIDGIIHYIDFPVSTIVPIICNSFDLPSASLESVLKCEHKYWSRVEQRAVVPGNIPNFAAFSPFDDDALATVKKELDFPFWMKPIKSFSSYLGFRIENEEQWEAAIAETRENIGRFSGPFNYLLSKVTMPEEFSGIGGEYCIAEGIIGGMQCTQEGFSCKGEVEVYGTIDSFREENLTTFSSYQYPSIMPLEVQERMTDISRRVIKHIGYDDAPFNIEYYWDRERDQIWLLEINTRISESHCQLFEAVDGCSHHQVAVELAVGRRPTFPHREGKHAVGGKFFLREWEDALVEKVPSPGIVQHIEQEVVPGSTIEIVAEEGKKLSDLMDQDSYSYRVALLFLGGSDKQDLGRKRDLCEELLYEHFVFTR
ncbi:MAG: ectoine synthase [Halioglobus sp.]|nr:ectoine synthase [Halioglobus sp.]